MAYPNGAIQLTGAIGTTSVVDTFPTNYDFLGFGGARSIDTISNMNAIPTARRQFGMLVTIYNDSNVANNKTYVLANAANGGVDNNVANNANFIAYGSSVFIGTGVGSVTSVGLQMPSAFCVSNSPITSSGDICVVGAGSACEYIRGDGTLANFPTASSGGASVNYYLNGGTSQGTIGGDTYYQMSRNAITGTAANFSISGTGLLAEFITDVADPNSLLIPAGNWNFEFYFNASSSGGVPSFYIELLTYDGSIFTSVASNIAVPEVITNGTSIDLYTTAIAVPSTVITTSDRLVIRVYVASNALGKTITFYTQDSHLAEIITTFAGGISALNGLTENTQYFACGTSGNNFNICSVCDTHTFNLPDASATSRGALTCADWNTFNQKGTVSCVNITSGAGICICGSAITSCGTICVVNTAPYSGEAVIVAGDGAGSSIRCGNINCACGTGSVVNGGCCNTVSCDFGVINGGCCNIVLGNFATVMSGNCNTVSNLYSAIFNGQCNQVLGCFSTASGFNNCVTGQYTNTFGCDLVGTSSCTVYVNNLCACGSLYSSAIAAGCAICIGTNGQLIGYSGNAVFTVNIPVQLSGGKTLGKYINGQTIPSCGCTAQQVITDIAQEYLAPSFSSFSMSGQSTSIEVGTVVSGSKTFAWGFNNSCNVCANSMCIVDTSLSCVLACNIAITSPQSISIVSTCATISCSHDWYGYARSTACVSINSGFRINWYWRLWYGTSASTTLNAAAIQALASSAISSSKNGTYNFAANNYKYFVWDDSLGSPTAVTGFKDASTNLGISMADVTDDVAYSNTQNGWSYALVSVNQNGVTSNKRVYRTKNSLGGTLSALVS